MTNYLVNLDWDWTEVMDKEQFLLHYPKHIPGRYMPQPWTTPDRYPCLMQEISIMSNPDGADHVILAFIYDYVEL